MENVTFGWHDEDDSRRIDMAPGSPYAALVRGASILASAHIARSGPECGCERRISPVKYAFGSVCVDGDARTVTRSGSAVHLRRKGFDLLLLLLDRRPQAVSKEEIYAHLWPDTFVTEASLQSLVHETRHAIDDPEPHQSWISAVHGIGYRFEGHATASEPPGEPERLEAPAAWLLGDSTHVALRRGENVVGRTSDGLSHVEAPSVSRRHARITIGESATIEDLGSKNGTWVEGERLTGPRALADGAVVRLGSVTFTFRHAREPQSTVSDDAPERQG
jgi:DNA-binding winged helix-turn-helix (wHTH) protein